jgi:hypothetical protein
VLNVPQGTRLCANVVCILVECFRSASLRGSFLLRAINKNGSQETVKLSHLNLRA